MAEAPLRAAPTQREVRVLRWLAAGARLVPPERPASTIYPMLLGDVRLTGVQRRLVRRLVATHRIAWLADQDAYAITPVGADLLATIPTRRGWA